MVGVEFLAHDPAFVKAAGAANGVGMLNRPAVGTKTHGGDDCFPLGPAVALIRVADSLLGNWHGDTPLKSSS